MKTDLNELVGKKVKIITKEREYIGEVYPHPDMLGNNKIILKLNSGYNIGISKYKIISVEVIRSLDEIKNNKTDNENSKIDNSRDNKEKFPFNPKNPTVLVLGVGGTISSAIDYSTGGVSAKFTSNELIKTVEEVSEKINIKTEQIMNIMSEDISPDDWKIIAEEVYKHLKDNEITGIVITHGTDTMHFTSSALSFFLDLNKPVVLTGSQRSADRGSSDAFMNLKCAIYAAAEIRSGEVYVVMHATSNDDYCYVHKGTRVRKMHTTRRDAFKTINGIPVAKIFPDGKIEMLSEYLPPKQLKKQIGFGKVGMLRVYPGINPDIVEYFINNGYKGLIIEGTALGHIPTKGKLSFEPWIKKAIDSGIIVVISTQTIFGKTHEFVYTNLRKLSIKLGCIFVNGMLSETAYVKLGWLLGILKDKKEIERLMQENLKDEFNKRILYEENFE